MPETLASVITKVSGVIQDTGGLLTTGAGGDLEQCIAEAVASYSRVIERQAVVDVAGDGAAYAFAEPAGFDPYGSRFVSIEYPAGARVPTLLPRDGWIIYRTSGAVLLQLLEDTPGAGQTLRLTYTVPHTITGLDGAVATTLSASHTWPFVKLASHYALLRLAARYLSEREATLNLDNVNRQSKSGEARTLANALLKEYQDELDLGRGDPPASVIVDWRSTVADTGISMLTHRRRRGR